MEFILERYCDSPKMGAFSELYYEGDIFAQSIEQPWNDNIPFKSCVPAGRYEARRFYSPKFKIETFALYNPDLDVYVKKHDDESRYACLFHPANWVYQLQGCIALGNDISADRKTGQWMVTNSRKTIDKFLDMTGNHEYFDLTIIWKSHP